MISNEQHAITNNVPSRRISLADLGREPFRILFPAAVLAGLIGVSLWPLYFTGVTQFYPGTDHARVMAYGLFGGFIFGFLGTAMPRMLSAKPLHLVEALLLVLLHATMVASFALTKVFAGDVLFLLLLTGFICCMVPRARQRKDIPPPGFVLVAMSFLCVAAGGVLAIVLHYTDEPEVFWVTLQKLFSYQGFVLLPILGIGPFILPRLFGMDSAHDFPESRGVPPGWGAKAIRALAAGALIVSSFICEAGGWYRTAHAVRFATTLIYLLIEMPFYSAPRMRSALGACVRLALIGILAGFLFVAVFPGYRVALLHFTLVGGFAVMAFVVATRVVLGHSGNGPQLQGRNRWLLIAVGLMWFGMATRISGDFWPKILASHYIYGALSWIAGVVLWAIYVLPKVLIADPEG
jgi:uncharacterized protein involved in response to NO